MTNSLALWLGAILIAAFSLDHYFWGSSGAIFLGRHLFDLIEMLAVWR